MYNSKSVETYDVSGSLAKTYALQTSKNGEVLAKTVGLNTS